jgi:hypothetical protein
MAENLRDLGKHLRKAAKAIRTYAPKEVRQQLQRSDMAPTRRDVGSDLVGKPGGVFAGQEIYGDQRSTMPPTARDTFQEEISPVFKGKTPGT